MYRLSCFIWHCVWFSFYVKVLKIKNDIARWILAIWSAIEARYSEWNWDLKGEANRISDDKSAKHIFFNVFQEKISYKASVKVQKTRVCKTRGSLKFCALGLIPIRWLLTAVRVDLKWPFERSLMGMLQHSRKWNSAWFSFYKSDVSDSRKSNHLTREFRVKFHLKNRHRTHRFAIRGIPVFA